MARKKQKPDMRRIRPSKTYTVEELARALNKSVATVRRWIRDGLPTLGEARPVLVDGAEMKAWLSAWLATRKHRCREDELYCCRCHCPRRPSLGSVSITLNNEKTLTVKGVCEVCGAGMRKLGSIARRAEIEVALRAFTQEKQSLSKYRDPYGTCTPGRDSQGSLPKRPDQLSQGDLFDALPRSISLPSNHCEISRPVPQGDREHE